MADQKEILHFVSYTQSKENGYKQVDKRIKERNIDKIQLPADCISFYFYDKVSKLKSKEEMINLAEDKNNISNTYYIGKEYNREQIIKELGANASILDDMEEMLADKVVKVKGDEFYILTDGDCVVSADKIHYSYNSPNNDYERVF